MTKPVKAGSLFAILSTLLTAWPAYAVPVSPVPEPATMILLGSGLAGLAAYRLYKEHK